jgi:hypothetical protein
VGRQGAHGGRGKRAATFAKAVRAVLGTGQLPQSKATTGKAAGEAKPPTRTRKSAATRKAEAAAQDQAAQSGSSVIEPDPETGLPRIRPEVAAKADRIAAEQAARNAG